MWFDDTGEDDIETITVWGDSSTPGGDIGGATKAAADRARWVLATGGTVLVASGGLLMVAGGISAWTGGGAGLVLPGFGMTVVGAGSLYVAHLLDKTVEDPPQPDYAKRVNMKAAGMNMPGPSRAPAQRALNHLNQLCVLAPNALDAMERQQGAALAGDTKWANGWHEAMQTLHGLSQARTLGLGQALTRTAEQMGGTAFSHAQVGEAIDFLQGKDGQDLLTKSVEKANMPAAISSYLFDTVKTLDAADYPSGINPADTLRSMGKGLTQSATQALAAY